jgi:hypothetical protein
MCPAAFLSHGTGVRIPVAVNPFSRGFAPRIPDTRSRSALRRLAPIAWLVRCAHSRAERIGRYLEAPQHGIVADTTFALAS